MPLTELMTDVTTYVPFCHSMVDIVLLPSACGSSHFPARPGTASCPVTVRDEEVGHGATVRVGIGNGGSITGGSVPDERVADGNTAGDNVGRGGVADCAISDGGVVALGVGMRELQDAMITIPAMAPINKSQNFLYVAIYFLQFQKNAE